MKLFDELVSHLFNSIHEIVENEELEFKGAKGGFPGSFWETYSAFANTNGGIIILGIKEKQDGLKSDNLTYEDVDKLQKDLWAGLGNRNTINLNLLNNDDVKPLKVEDSYVLIVMVPRASRDQRPVHVGHDPYSGTYRRGYEGDFKCTRSEVQRMFADADLTRTTDKRILDGFTIDDIDKESLRQYRQLFNIAKPDHVWSTLDDFSFLRQLGAYRKDRRSGEEGFTVAGILMFGKSDAITDDECLPNFFPDYRNETTFNDTDRWLDRIYPDGTWEANLFQFYLRTLPRLQSFLPKPFSIKDNQRIDQSPAHVAIREVFVNLCVHPDYKAEGSLTVIFKNGTYFFSNPGTMLVSQEQFFEGGESICRNPTIQKMFMMLGPAEKAGSGGAKIMDGWRRNNWKAPFIFERTRPDKVEFWLSMQSLIQPEVLDELSKRLGLDAQKLSSQIQTVLALALTEGYVTNERLRYVLRLHKSDITSLLQQMCKEGWLLSDGYGRGTKYHLVNRAVSDNEVCKNGNVDSLETNVDSLETNVDSLETNVDSSKIIIEESNLSEEARSLLKRKRLSQSEMETLICEITSDWRTIQDLVLILGKDKSYLRNHVLPSLISRGVLEREYASIPNHPNQRYRRAQS
ncbi:MAG: AAA family ATPase [Bacteroidales bacterium]|nr:AAA family ATPase [Bacteroidales bacterium]